MKVRLDIRKLHPRTPVPSGPLRLHFRIGSSPRITSQYTHPSQGAYPYFEKHTLWLEDDQPYVEVIIQGESAGTVGQITVFKSKMVFKWRGRNKWRD